MAELNGAAVLDAGANDPELANELRMLRSSVDKLLKSQNLETV